MLCQMCLTHFGSIFAKAPPFIICCQPLPLSASPWRQLIINHLHWKQYCWTSSSFKVFLPISRSTYCNVSLQVLWKQRLWCYDAFHMDSLNLASFSLSLVTTTKMHMSCLEPSLIANFAFLIVPGSCHDFPYLLSRPSIDCQTRIGRSG